MSAVHRRAARWSDDRGLVSIAVVILTLVVLAGAGLVYDGGRALAARREIINAAEAAARAGAATIGPYGLDHEAAVAATSQQLAQAGIGADEVVGIDVDIVAGTVSVTLQTSRPAVFASLLGNERLIVRGTGTAIATYGASG